MTLKTLNPVDVGKKLASLADEGSPGQLLTLAYAVHSFVGDMTPDSRADLTLEEKAFYDFALRLCNTFRTEPLESEL